MVWKLYKKNWFRLRMFQMTFHRLKKGGACWKVVHLRTLVSTSVWDCMDCPEQKMRFLFKESDVLNPRHQPSSTITIHRQPISPFSGRQVRRPVGVRRPFWGLPPHHRGLWLHCAPGDPMGGPNGGPNGGSNVTQGIWVSHFMGSWDHYKV